MVYSVNKDEINEVVEKNNLVVLYITAPWCGPCKLLSPTMDKLSIDFGTSVHIAKMDADENMDYVKSLNVRNVPTLIFYHNGQEVERSTGNRTRSQLEETLNKYVEISTDF
ncbi:thioredoxin [bacterium]|nr:thioredoxin [bacterium]